MNTATPITKPEPLMQDRLAACLDMLSCHAATAALCGLPEVTRRPLVAAVTAAVNILSEYNATETRGTRIKSLRDFLHTLDEKLSALESKPYLDPDEGREWRNLRRQRREAEAQLDAMAA